MIIRIFKSMGGRMVFLKKKFILTICLFVSLSERHGSNRAARLTGACDIPVKRKHVKIAFLHCKSNEKKNMVPGFNLKIERPEVALGNFSYFVA